MDIAPWCSNAWTTQECRACIGNLFGGLQDSTGRVGDGDHMEHTNLGDALQCKKGQGLRQSLLCEAACIFSEHVFADSRLGPLHARHQVRKTSCLHGAVSTVLEAFQSASPLRVAAMFSMKSSDSKPAVAPQVCCRSLQHVGTEIH